MELDHRIHPDFAINDQALNGQKLNDWLGQNINSPKSIYQKAALFIRNWMDDTQYMEMKTSGSTGTPKTIRNSKESMIWSAKNTNSFFVQNPGSRALLCLPIDFVAGKMMLVRAMVCGWNIILTEPSLNPLEEVESEHKFDFAAMIPAQVKNSIDRISQIDCLIIGGARIDYGLRQKLNTLQNRIYETYGMTETLTHVAARKISQNTPLNGPFVGLSGCSFSTDSRGCLCINAVGISEELIVTNDLVQLMDSRRFNWIGRVDNVVNSGGIKISPEKVENILDKKITLPFFVSGIPDEVLGHRLVLFIEGGDEDDVKEIKESFESLPLDRFEVPKNIFCVEKFVQNANNKLDRQKTIEEFLLRGSADKE